MESDKKDTSYRNLFLVRSECPYRLKLERTLELIVDRCDSDVRILLIMTSTCNGARSCKTVKAGW